MCTCDARETHREQGSTSHCYPRPHYSRITSALVYNTMGSSQRYLSGEAALTALVVVGALGLGYTQISGSRMDTKETEKEKGKGKGKAKWKKSVQPYPAYSLTRRNTWPIQHTSLQSTRPGFFSSKVPKNQKKRKPKPPLLPLPPTPVLLPPPSVRTTLNHPPLPFPLAEQPHAPHEQPNNPRLLLIRTDRRPARSLDIGTTWLLRRR